MRSMTGFGQAQGNSVGYRIAVALRAVNHRYLDLVIRTKEPCRASEPAVRALLQSELARGRVEASIEVSAVLPRAPRVTVRRELLVALVDALAGIEARPPVLPEVRLGDLLRLPEVVSVEASTESFTEADEQALLEVTRQALDALLATREREGDALLASLSRDHARLRDLVATLAKRQEAVRRALFESLRQRLAELVALAGLDSGRLEQEAALLAERSDVKEELDRLWGHLDHFAEALHGAGPAGRRLDFLAQEISRELNTLGAKGRDSELSRLVVEAKIVCEQLREQVQNVE